MKNKTMTNKLKKTGVKSLCAIMAAASMMSIAMPVFAESNENLDECYAVETQIQDELMPVSEAVSVEETAPVEEAAVEETAPVEEAAVEETAPVEEAAVEKEAPVEKEKPVEEAEDVTVHEEDSQPEAMSQATTETPAEAPKYKPMLDENRAAWIYREMNPNWDLEGSGEVTPVEPVGVVEPIDKPGLYKTRKRDATEEEIWKGEYDEVLSYNKKVDQYKIQPGKYYHIVIDRPNPDYDAFMPLMRCNRRIQDWSFVKVLDVYEDPKWYGSERTVEYMDVATGKIHKMQPNAKWFGIGTPGEFREVYSIKRIIERRYCG